VDSFDFLFCFKFNKKSLTGLISFIPEGFDTLQYSIVQVIAVGTIMKMIVPFAMIILTITMNVLAVPIIGR
jgi:hypothetical protein